jgi:hypothetical protein
MDIRVDRKDFLTTYTNLPNGPIKNVVDEVIQALKDGSIVGEHVKKKQIPQYYKQRHNVQVLYRVSLPQHWRLIYTFLTLNEGEKPRPYLLELMDHDQYNKRFGYFKKKSA